MLNCVESKLGIAYHWFDSCLPPNNLIHKHTFIGGKSSNQIRWKLYFCLVEATTCDPDYQSTTSIIVNLKSKSYADILHLNMNTLESAPGEALLSCCLPYKVRERQPHTTWICQGHTHIYAPSPQIDQILPQSLFHSQRDWKTPRGTQTHNTTRIWSHTVLRVLPRRPFSSLKIVSPKICDRIYSCSLLMKNPAVLCRGWGAWRR